MASTRELVVKLTAETGQFARAMSAQTASINKFAGIAKSAGIALLGFMGVQQVGAFAKEVIDATGAAADMARDIGASVEQVDALTWAAKLAGLEASNLHGMMTKLSVATQKFSQGGASKAFEALGLDKAATAGKNAYSMLKLIGERTKNLNNLQATGIFSELFGKGSAIRMWDFFGNLEDTEKKIREIYDTLGLSNESTLNVEALDDSFVELKTTLGLITRVAVNELGPALISVAEGAAEAVLKTTGFYRDYLTVIGDASDKAKEKGKGFWGILKAQYDAITDINRSAEKTYSNVADGIRAAKDEGEDLFDLFANMGKQIMAAVPVDYEDLGAQADKLIESLKTAQEKYMEAIGNYSKMKEYGFLDDDQFSKAIEKQREELEKATPELQELKKVIEENADPLKKLAEARQKLEGWNWLGFLDADTYRSALRKLEKETADTMKRLSEETVEKNPLLDAWREQEETMQSIIDGMRQTEEERSRGSASTASSLSEIIGRANEGKQDYERDQVAELKRANQLLERLANNMRAYVPVYG
jgi:hypothetical protein